MVAVSEFAGRVWAEPLAKILITTFALSSTFGVSMLMAIGADFIPLIEKADLIATLAIYAGLWGIGVRLAWHMVQVFIATYRDLLPQGYAIRLPAWLRVRSVPYRKRSKWERMSVGLGVLPLVAVLVIWQGLQDAGWLDLVMITLFLTIPSILCWLLKVPFATPMTSGFMLIVAIASGVVWVNEHRLSDRPSMITVDAQTKPFSILLRADQGLIGFYPGVREAQFVPWHKIEGIAAARRKQDDEAAAESE